MLCPLDISGYPGSSQSAVSGISTNESLSEHHFQININSLFFCISLPKRHEKRGCNAVLRLMIGGRATLELARIPRSKYNLYIGSFVHMMLNSDYWT